MYSNRVKDVREFEDAQASAHLLVRLFCITNTVKLETMPVEFKMVAKQNNLVSPPEVKYFPCAVSKDEVDLDNLADIISSRSTMSKADCYGVIIALTETIGDALTNGSIVKLKSLGTFRLTLQGTAANTVDDLGKSNIKGAKVIYKPSKEINSKLKEVTYKRVR